MWLGRSLPGFGAVYYNLAIAEDWIGAGDAWLSKAMLLELHPQLQNFGNVRKFQNVVEFVKMNPCPGSSVKL